MDESDDDLTGQATQGVVCNTVQTRATTAMPTASVA